MSGHVTSHKNKSNPHRRIPHLLSHWSVCFAFSVLVKTKGPLVIASAEESKHKKKSTRRSYQQHHGIWGAEFGVVPLIKITELHNLTVEVFSQ